MQCVHCTAHPLGLEKSAIECNKDIHAKCDILVSIVERKRKFLINKIRELKTKRRMEMEAQLHKIQEMNSAAFKTQSECKQIAMKHNLSTSSRLEQMNATLDAQNEMETKLNLDVDKINCSDITLAVTYDHSEFISNFDAALKVKFNDERFELKLHRTNKTKN